MGNHTHHSHEYTATVEQKPHSIAVISVVVPAETLASHRQLALTSIGKEAHIDGFRKGHIPEKVLVERVGEMAILNETAEIVIRHIYPHILDEKELDAIGAPEVAITKLAPLNPLEFTVTISLMPDIVLSDYKAIAKEKNAKKEVAVVTDKDVSETIDRIVRQRVVYERMQAKSKEQKDAPTEEQENEEDYAKLPLPELTDEYVAGLGNFKTVDEFKTQVRAHIEHEKQVETTAKHRAALTDAIVEKTAIDLPEIFIESELAQMFGEMESDITRAGLKFEDYLTHIKKTREGLKAEWRASAEKRAKLQLVLNEIAKKESIEPESDAVDREVEQLLAQFKDADKDRVRLYVLSTLRNDRVLSMLETIAE